MCLRWCWKGSHARLQRSLQSRCRLQLWELVPVPTATVGPSVERPPWTLTFKRPAKSVCQYLDGSLQIATALARFKADVESGAYPGDDESYHLPGELKSELPEILDRIRSSQGNQTDLDFSDS